LAVTVAGLLLSVASAGTITGPGSSKPVRAKGLTPKERAALKIVSVKATGVEPLGVIVTATFRGNIEQALGRGHLADAIVALILRPKDSSLAFSGVATFGAGAIGRTARKTRSSDVGVLRKGRTVTFFIGGPGFENVGKIEVKAFAKAPSGHQRGVASGSQARHVVRRAEPNEREARLLAAGRSPVGDSAQAAEADHRDGAPRDRAGPG
jgi:hypothetical protein